MAKYLDENGLVYLWNKIKGILPTKTSELTNDSGFITSSDIPEGAAASTTTPKMNGTAAVGTETAFARGDHVHPTDTSRAPLASPTFTGTPKAPTAGTSTSNTQIATTAFVHGITDSMASSLTQAEEDIVNLSQNKPDYTFGTVKVGSTNVVADSKTDTLELVAGSNVTLTPDATNDKITIAATNTTYSTASASSNGLMSSTDKSKLDTLATYYNESTELLTADYATTATELANERTIDGVKFKGSSNVHHYATCSTAAGTAAKVASFASGYGTGFTLDTGASVYVKFTNANSVASPTLNVASSGAKAIYRYGTTAPSTSASTSWQAGSVVHFVYDGTYWQMVGWLNDTGGVSASAMQEYVSGEISQVYQDVADTYATKSSITNAYVYKGSKASYSALPSTGNATGDVWNTEDTGMNYAWTGSAWDSLGQVFSVTSITNSEIDTICT